MIDLGFINVTGAVVGQTFTLDWHNARIEPTLRQQGANITDYISIYNESGCGFLVTMNQTQRSFTLPAGGWAPEIPVTVPGGVDLSLTLTVEYLLPLPAVSQVHADYFIPGESPSGASIVLGNSPINGSVTGLVATTLVNVGNSAGTNIVNASPSGTGGNIQVFNDGSRITHLLDTGLSVVYESLQNGAALTSPVVSYGNASNLAATTFNGTGNFGNTTIGTLISAGGVATVGQWVSVKHTSRQHVAVNTATTILTFSAPATGDYRASCSIAKANTTSSAVTLNALWNDPLIGSTGGFFSCDNGGAYLNLRGVTGITNGVFNCFPLVFQATTSTTISISFTDPSGTANDTISADVELSVL